MKFSRRDLLKSSAAVVGTFGATRAIRPARAAGKEVRIRDTGEAYGAAMKVAAEAFGKKTGIKVTIDQLPYGDAYNKQVLLGTAGSDAYDIMVLDCICV